MRAAEIEDDNHRNRGSGALSVQPCSGDFFNSMGRRAALLPVVALRLNRFLRTFGAA
jgi:hypothetical protein